MALSSRDDHGERPPLPIAGHVELGRQAAAAASQPLVVRMLDPLFTSARLGRRRAPLACWWARAVELSTLTSQTTSPAASERVWAWARLRSQVPSRRQRYSRSAHVCHGP